MVKKHGPCLHCGIHFTPLWRNGPEEKPVLCNACGSRYRIWGNLEDYLPKNFQPEHLDNLKNLNGESNLSVDAGNDITDGKNPCLWDPKIPSKKRSRVVYKKVTPMNRFHRQLVNILKHVEKSNESSPEEVLLMHNVNKFIPSNEIGLGVILLKPDSSYA